MADDRTTHLNRREMLSLLVTGAITAPAAAAAPLQGQTPQFSALDHFEFYVSNADRSRDFFTRIFGNDLLSRGTKRYLKLGSAYMAFEPPRPNTSAASVDHASLSIKGLEMPKLHALLEERGVAYQDYPSGRDTAVFDPDGARIQLSPENGWNLLTPPNFAPETVALAESPAFRPIALDHVLYYVMDLSKAVGFYQKILGAPTSRDNSATWFAVGSSRLGVVNAPAGQRPGVRHIAVSVAPFDDAAATRVLSRIGAQLETPGGTGRLEFRDPDGFRLQVIAAR